MKSRSQPTTSCPVPDEQLKRLQAELDSLSNQENVLINFLQTEETNLQKKIAEKRSSLASLEALLAQQQHSVPSTRLAPSARNTNHRLPDFLVSSSERVPQQQQQQSLQQVYKQQEERSTELFLRPTRSVVTSCGKPLRIVDFISRLIPNEEERLLSTDNGTDTRLVLSLGSKVPKLSSVTLEQYSIANIRIFYELLSSNRLLTLSDIRDYLSYSVKVYELTRKFTWESVLRYDDEYRVLQHVYGYP